MTEPRFTPGPWVAMGPMPDRSLIGHYSVKPIFDEGLWYILPENNVERLPIAIVDCADDHYEPLRTITAPSDAHLIAAAPEMYGAIKAMIADDAFAELCAGIGEEPEWLKLGKLAIAKAEGNND
jgi:hypothetical protein